MQVACGVIYKKSRILLVKKAYGDYKNKWEFPGGKRDKFDRSIKQCLKRELIEELNCNSKIGDLIYFMKIKKEDSKTSKDLFLYFYNAQLLSHTITLSKEHTSYKWVSFDEARGMDLIRWDFKLLKYFENYLNKHNFTLRV